MPVIVARPLVLFFWIICAVVVSAQAADWSAPEWDLAHKIAAVTGSTAISLTFENRSSLGRRDAEIIQNGLRSALGVLGIRTVQSDPTAATVTVSLSENVTSYVWVAQVPRPDADPSVVMVAVPRAANRSGVGDTVPLSLRKTLLWSQTERILDVAVLEESGGTSRIAVLSGDKVSIYRIRGGSSQLEAAAEISHSHPWPRDLRGRIFAAKDRALDVYLPGVACHGRSSGVLNLDCRDGNDPWPLLAIDVSRDVPGAHDAKAFFEASRNFFTGIDGFASGALKSVPQFYSAALLPGDKTPIWLFAALDGKIHTFDGSTDRVSKVDWGSNLASVRTQCGAGWQVLATSANLEGTDTVRAFEVSGQDPVGVSAAIDFSGTISALWTEARGDTAVAITRNAETGNYEALRLAVACGQ